MPYTSFLDISDVCEKFDYDVENVSFIKSKNFIINEYFKENILRDFYDNATFTNETSICERLIYPMLAIVARENNLPVWSHTQFNVDEKLNLVGTPDYILAPAVRGGQRFTTPVVCLAEAKRDDFIAGWAQVSAEMIAAQIKNKNSDIPIFGLVSTGKNWEFGKLIGKKFTIEPSPHSAPTELQNIFDILNWMFSEAYKNSILLNS